MLYIFAVAMAVADSIVVSAYVTGINPAIVQGAALGFKLLIIPFILRRDSLIVGQLPLLAAFLGLCLISLAAASNPEAVSTVRILSFFANLAITLMLVKDEVPAYLKTTAYVVTSVCIVFLLFVAAGRVEDLWGRYLFFGEQFNLGGEIAAAGVIAGAISLPYRRAIVSALPAIGTVLLLQARSALIALALSLMLRTFREIYETTSSRRNQWLVLVSIPAAAFSVAVLAPLIAKAMLITDTNRGLSSGVAGRGDLWAFAWQAFLDRPLTGQGLGWLASRQDLGAHNFFLYGLAEMGLLAVPVFVAIAVLAWRSYRIHGNKLISIAPIFVMTIFNDRFVNLNLYPYLLWFFLVALSSPKWIRSSDAAPQSRAPRGSRRLLGSAAAT